LFGVKEQHLTPYYEPDIHSYSEKIMSPKSSDIFLSTHVPYCELVVFICYGFNIETQSRRGLYNFTCG